MKFVLDQNMARRRELDLFLQAGNEVILTDDFIIEPFKSNDPISTIDCNLIILRKYPAQVLVAYDRGELVQHEIASCVPINSSNIISTGRTEYIRNLLKLNNDDLKQELCLLETSAKSRIEYQNDFLEKYIRNGAKAVSDLLKAANEIEKYNIDTAMKLQNIREVAFEVLYKFINNKCGNIDMTPFLNINSITFSQSFILLWRTVFWATKHGFQNAKKQIQGDSFDIKYVLISCFFDGIFTREDWLIQCREHTVNNFS